MRNALDILSSEFERRKDSVEEELPIVVIAILHEKATAPSYRRKIRKIFDSKEKVNVIGALNSREIIVKFYTISDLQRIYSIFKEEELSSLSKVKRCGRGSVIGLELFRAYTEENLLGHLLKVRLIDYLDSELNERSEDVFMRICMKCGLIAKKVFYCEGLRMFTIQSTQDEVAIQRIATLGSVFSVKKMPFIEPCHCR